MPRSRPQLSITLPKNFTFNPHYSDGPQTPDRPQTSPVTRPPSTHRPYQIKRRSRPALTGIFRPDDISHDRPQPLSRPFALPSVAASQRDTSTGDPDFLNCPPEPLHMPALRSPRTPEPRLVVGPDMREASQDEEIILKSPLSTCSFFSESSDESARSMISYPAGDGSCTSPESELPSRKFLPRREALIYTHNASGRETSEDGSSLSAKAHWTDEMDSHLWSTYLRYLQDSTMTPFKMLPGVAPPLGVCHRVAREARKTWSRNKHRKAIRSPRPIPSPSRTMACPSIYAKWDTEILGNERVSQGDSTPVVSRQTLSLYSWPKSGSSTRRRLRYLCKHRPNIAPHYQRLLQSRTPSPFSSSHSSCLSSSSQPTVASSPPFGSSAAFNTRNIELSLITSTADTMQPDNPLTQLATSSVSFQKRDFEDFNEPPVPFASEISIPSDIERQPSPENTSTRVKGVPRLGSPFSHHTWGPSRTEQRTRPRVHRSFASEFATIRPSYGIAMDLANATQSPSLHKRRALHYLGDSGHCSHDSDAQERFHGSRDRTTLYDAGQHPLQSLFTVPATPDDANTPISLAMTSSVVDEAGTCPRQAILAASRSLDSPFQISIPKQPGKSLQILGPDTHVSAAEYPSESGDSNGQQSTEPPRFDQLEKPLYASESTRHHPNPSTRM